MRWMLRLRWVFLLCLVVLMMAGSVGAGEGDTAAETAAEADQEVEEARLEVLEEALSLLRVRMEARLRAADALRGLGRLDEALEAYRAIDRVYAQGMATVQALLAGAGSSRSDAPFHHPKSASSPPLVPIPGFRLAPALKPPWIGDAPGDIRYAVDRALDWLAAHQSASGGWSSASFGAWCKGKPVAAGPDGAGKPVYDVGVSGLALSAFLGAGYTNRGAHPYAKVVSRGLRYLKNVQDAEGCFGPRASQHYIYNHAAAAQAMVEAYGLTLSPIFRGSAQKALDFLAQARNPYFGWRYGIKPGDNDTSITGWMILVLARAREINRESVEQGRPAPLTLDEAAFEGARHWLEKMTDPDFGRVGYIQRGGQPARPIAMMDRFPGEKSEAMTAVGLATRLLIGDDPRTNESMQKGAKLLEALPPVWNPDGGTIDLVYWYYGTQAALGMGGTLWNTWSPRIRQALVKSQRQDAGADADACGYRGSWDPVGPWGPDGGRVYATALSAMTLETLARGLR